MLPIPRLLAVVFTCSSVVCLPVTCAVAQLPSFTPALSGYKLKFQDEFNGTSINSEVWQGHGLYATGCNGQCPPSLDCNNPATKLYADTRPVCETTNWAVGQPFNPRYAAIVKDPNNPALSYCQLVARYGCEPCGHEDWVDAPLTCCDDMVRRSTTAGSFPASFHIGMLVSKPIVAQTLGKFGIYEIRCRWTKSVVGVEPDFWLWNESYRPVSDYCNVQNRSGKRATASNWSEIDVFETITWAGQGNNGWIPTCHFATKEMCKYGAEPECASGHTEDLHNFDAEQHYHTRTDIPGDDFFEPQKGYHPWINQQENGWHIWAIEWAPNFIRWYFDGVMVEQVCAHWCESFAPMDIIVGMNVDAKGFNNKYLHPSNPSDAKPIPNGIFPFYYDIDYVRVFQLENSPSTGTADKTITGVANYPGGPTQSDVKIGNRNLMLTEHSPDCGQPNYPDQYPNTPVFSNGGGVWEVEGTGIILLGDGTSVGSSNPSHTVSVKNLRNDLRDCPPVPR